MNRNIARARQILIKVPLICLEELTDDKKATAYKSRTTQLCGCLEKRIKAP